MTRSNLSQTRGSLDAVSYTHLDVYKRQAHGGPEIKGSRPDLKNSRMAEYLHHVADRQEVTNSALEFRILQTAVC